ncbi:Bgt-20310 [Blumeria graminis f. sp. tritici]|uniref:Bgt-20310 n=1 Tax=Blumeria graminis f. sp. tritici TaxID=62690 RepID=A0A9X9MNT6_BLUGR|nr:Bgt-20310 [Blumeria graminis f. sp. tritici]
MSSLRTVAANNHRQINTYEPIHSASTAQPKTSPNPDARCKRCRHIQTNKRCFKQHPELATGKKGQKLKENVQKYGERLGKGKAIAEASDS